ncbi:MAG: anaerobic ribonucleoside-triphosphate reductase activating protein [Lachnospiraceae bacterium]|nr:anaerobic ribonucleoside-triphosphate reductase activating protein [Lachnospiraceae bacterium]
MLRRYNTIKYNDVANAPGISVSIYLQGCPHHCKGCFNPETWDYNGGQELTEDLLENLFQNKINKNGIKRSLCILGGEPLCEENIATTYTLASMAKSYGVNVYIWTGYVFEELEKTDLLFEIFENTDYLIDGPFIEEEKDITLKMRGSRNQRVIDIKKYLKKEKNYVIIV